MRFSFVIALILIISMGCRQSKSKPITEVSQNELNNVILVDVRTPEEHAAGHIENSLNINWYSESFVKRFDTIDKDDTIYLYCKMGSRSAKAQALLDSLGYNKVVDLEGGYDAYTKSR